MATRSSAGISYLQIPPVTVRVHAALPAVQAHLAFFYDDFRHLWPAGEDDFVDFDIAIRPGRGLRRFWRAQSRFQLDGDEPFLPLPLGQAAPLLEWGLNWCMASRPLGYLAMHAAVVARNDEALMLPGFPGAGKSTLCAALVFLGGWRLLSDELALLDPSDGCLHPHPRPINLKNRSIELVAAFPGARIGPRHVDTRKGTVALAAPPTASVAAARRPARCRHVIFPTFVGAGPGWCETVSRAESFALIAEQSFNKDRMGAAGFAALSALLDGVVCHQIGYRSTEEALEMIERICAQR